MRRRVGAFASGDYLVVKAPSGEHVLSVDMSLSSGEMIRKKLLLGGGSTRYFHVGKGLVFRIREDSSEEAYIAEAPKHPVFELSTIEA